MPPRALHRHLNRPLNKPRIEIPKAQLLPIVLRIIRLRVLKRRLVLPPHPEERAWRVGRLAHRSVSDRSARAGPDELSAPRARAPAGHGRAVGAVVSFGARAASSDVSLGALGTLPLEDLPIVALAPARRRDSAPRAEEARAARVASGCVDRRSCRAESDQLVPGFARGFARGDLAELREGSCGRGRAVRLVLHLPRVALSLELVAVRARRPARLFLPQHAERPHGAHLARHLVEGGALRAGTLEIAAVGARFEAGEVLAVLAVGAFRAGCTLCRVCRAAFQALPLQELAGGA
mmetsp:Transcript_67467/g.155065  ORF Transcript_67467/g.155065 Transcript_67467/m.155065 type:complete len:293 (-) Transcript_67467:3273-4151(-)